MVRLPGVTPLWRWNATPVCRRRIQKSPPETGGPCPQAVEGSQFLAVSAPVVMALPAAETSRPTPEMVLQADTARAAATRVRVAIFFIGLSPFALNLHRERKRGRTVAWSRSGLIC